jgi:hypothetical protein
MSRLKIKDIIWAIRPIKGLKTAGRIHMAEAD